MSLAVADKLLRAFEALKNFKDGTATSDPNVAATAKKKETTLSRKDRISNLNVIGDLTNSPLLRNLSEFGKLIAVSIETLLSFCDDEDEAVRNAAGDCINRIIKGFMDANVARVHVELYKEIKKNGNYRCLRAALSKFAEISHLIRPQKCRPFITNLLPCLARICIRPEELIQETLATAMKTIMPVLGAFMNDKETKILLKTFLQNISSSCATTRRTAATSITMVCLHARKPATFFSWIINILLEMMLPFTADQNSPTYCGVLLCLRHIVPHLGKEEQECEVVMRGSFGVIHQQKRESNEEMLEKEEKQLLQMYKLIMLSTKHTDHNVVAAGLFALQHLLQSPPKKLLYQLLSQKGLVAFSREDRSESFLSSTLDDIDTLSLTSQPDSGIEETLGEIGVDGASEKVGKGGTSAADIQELRRHFSQPENEASETVVDTASEVSEDSAEGSSYVDTDNDSVLGHRETGSNTSGIISQASSTEELDRDETEQDMMVEDSEEREADNQGVDEGFDIDPVVCSGVPILHCARVMCSFLLSGKSGEILSDRASRAMVKHVALNCLAAIFKIHPQAFLQHVAPKVDGEGDNDGSNRQLIRDVLLYVEHHDPTIRGSIAFLIGEFLQSSLVRSRYDFHTWCAEICEKCETDCVDIDILLRILEKLALDESGVTVKMTCLGIKEFLPILCASTCTTLTVQFCRKLIKIKQNPYWLVKAELTQIISNINFSLIAFLEKQASNFSSQQTTRTCSNLQQTFFHNVVLELLADKDPRVRSKAAETVVELVRNMFFENTCSSKEPLLAVAKRRLGKAFGYSSGNENSVIKTNLAKVITTLSLKLNVAISKHALLGYCEALSLLSKSYPPPSWPICWSCDVHAITRSPSPTGKTGFPGNIPPAAPFPDKPHISSVLCNNGGGSLSFVVELMTSSWLTFNLPGHEDALLLAGNLLLGIASSSLSLGQSVTSADSSAKWSVFCDSAISSLAEKVFVHVLRLLNICLHVIDNITPGAHSAKASFLGKDKEKPPTPIPGAAVPTTNTASATVNVANPKKLLNRSRRNTEVAETANVGGDKGPTGKSSENEGKTSPPGTPVGQFHHLPHYYRLYEIVKGAFGNYKENLKFHDDDKFVKLLKNTLTVFATLLELATFTDIGKTVEEIIGYLQAAVKCEGATTFLCVQQMLRAIFGVNLATQPESSSSNSPQQKDALITEVQLPPCLEDSIKDSDNVGFYQSYFEEFQQEISRSFEEIRKTDETKESKSFKDLGFIKRLRQRRGSFRPPIKVDKQVHIHSYIRMFEPLVIQALKDYTSSSDIQVQAQVLSILVQLIRLRVNYALLDSEQAFLKFVLKQFEFIEAGQISRIESFSPHVFQFLILLSYECFQPKFNQAKSVFGMERIIQVCDDLMACGQSARTHAIPALCPIVYDLFDTQAIGRNENTKELETQREVFISMLLRLAQFPEVLGLLVYVLTFYRKNDEKWKKFSRQAVDVSLQMLSKQKVIVDDIDGLRCLENLLDSVAPIALRPLDVILKAIFAPANLPNTLLMKRWLSQVIVLLKVIITQNTEENLLSRITQLGLTGGLIGNIVDNDEQDVSDVISETDPAKVMVYFLFHALYLAIKNVATVSESRDTENVEFISQLTSYLLLYVQEIVRSGLFKNISRAGSTALKENLLSCEETPQVEKTKKIHQMVTSLKETRPILSLQWIQLVFLLGFDNEAWWTTLQDRMLKQESFPVNTHIFLKGTFLVWCKVLSSQLTHAENISIVQSFVRENLINIVEMSDEPPVRMLLRQIQSSSTCSQVFIDVVNDSCRNQPNRIHTLEFRKSLLVILDNLHYKQSSSLIQLLIREFLNSHYRAITRKCETMICSRLEYSCVSSKEEVEEFISSEDMKSIHNSLVSIGATKRNPRLASLITHISSESLTVPTIETTIDCKAAITAVKAKQTSGTNWFSLFVYNCCCCWKMNEVGIKSSSEVVYLLHALSFDEISKIMDDEKFNISLLSPCLAFGIKKTIEIYSRKFDQETPSNLFEDTSYFDSYGVDHLFQCAFGLLLRHVQEIVFSVTTFDENDQPTQRTASSEISLIQSTMNSSQVKELSENFTWKRKLFDITKGLELYLSLMNKLPTAALLPKAIYCAVCQFGMITLEVLCCENRQYEHCCTSELTTVLHCFSQMLHSRKLYFVLNSSEYSSWVCRALRSVYFVVRAVFVQPGIPLPEDEAYSDLSDDSEIPLKQASMLVNYLYTLLHQTSHHSFVSDTLTRSFHDVITGLSRLTIFNSYVRVPPVVWKMGWGEGEGEHGTELPPLPIDILREKDVLQDFVLRVHSIGWISRQQFEETWAALLGVLSSPLSPEQTSREEDIDSIKSGCLALQCITALLLQTTLCPLPGNPSVGTNLHTSRQKELPFLDSRAGRKLCAVRRIVEDHFIQQCPQSTTWQTGGSTENLYGENIERVSGLYSYALGQICINSLQTQCVPVDEFDDTNSASTGTSSPVSTQDKIDVRSCVQFLMELFEQWVSPYTQPKTPLMLLTQSVKSLLIISDLFVDTAQYEWMLSELLDLYQNYPSEDEIMMQYLLPALCKALAVLKMEGVIPEKVVKVMEAAFKAPHIPLQVSGLYGGLYFLESHIPSVVSLVIPLVTDYITKVLALVTDSSIFGEHRLLVLLSISFYLLEHYENEIVDAEFKKNFLKTVITMASSGDEDIPLHLYHAIIRGLERLVVSFSLSREDSDFLVKFSVDRLAMRNPQKAISALGLLLTCMYTGKEGDRPSGLFQETEAVDTPTDEILLVALERVTALFDRIRKGFRSEAKLVSEILPIVLGDFFPPTDVMNKVIGEFLSSQQPHPELMASVLYKVCEQLISKGQQASVKDWVLLSLGSFTQRPPLGMAVWSFTSVFIAASANKWIRALFQHVVSRIGKLENIDRTYFLLTATDFYHNQNLTEDEKKSFLSTFEKVAQPGNPYADLLQSIVS